MRYCVISDMHSNLEAFRAILDSVAEEKIDAYLCLGDVVGYGANPKEVIRLTRSLNCKAIVAGNHDWAVLGITDIEYFNEAARDAVIWTKGVLDKDELDYLKMFSLVYKDEKYTLVHGSLENPEEFNYILYGDDAYRTIRLMETPLCFVGHSHVAGIYYSDNKRVLYTKGPKVKIDFGKRYVINVGSIGQPRDGDPRTGFVIYDDEEGVVEIRRVTYDVKTAQKKIIDSGLPKWLAYRLQEGM